MKLSILDQSVAIADKCQDQVINDTLNLSTIAEELGYSDFGYLNITIIQQLLVPHQKF